MIFENTKFDTKYRTSDGRKAMYCMTHNGTHCLMVENEPLMCNYDDNGIFTGYDNPALNITGLYDDKSNLLKYETYGAHLRNLLGPCANLACLASALITDDIDVGMFKRCIKHDPSEYIDILVDFSKNELMEEMNWRSPDNKDYKEF